MEVEERQEAEEAANTRMGAAFSTLMCIVENLMRLSLPINSKLTSKSEDLLPASGSSPKRQVCYGRARWIKRQHLPNRPVMRKADHSAGSSSYCFISL